MYEVVVMQSCLTENQQQGSFKLTVNQSTEMVNEQQVNQNINGNATISLPFRGGICELQKRRFSLAVNLNFKPPSEQDPKSFEEMFPPQMPTTQLNFIISSRFLSPALKQIFPNISQLFDFLSASIGDEEKVIMSPTDIKLTVGDRSVVLSISELLEMDRERSKVVINLERIEDRLLQFSQKEWKIIQDCSKYISNQGGQKSRGEQQEGQVNGELNNQQTQKDRQYSAQFALMDQELFLERFCPSEFQDQEKSKVLQQRIMKIQQEMQQFQHQFPQIQSLTNNKSKPPVTGTNYAPIYSTPERPNLPTIPSMHATSPYQQKSISAPMSAEDNIRMRMIVDKREKLKVSKQMLKMGYSTDEVIGHLQNMEISQRNGVFDPATSYKAPAHGPVRPFHLARQEQQQPMRQRSRVQSSEREIQQSMIKLLRERKFRKLQDIQQQMQKEGVSASLDQLRRILDEIKARNLQRKRQVVRQ